MKCKTAGVMAAAALSATANAIFVPPASLSTPPMGFNNWARFMTNLSESMFTATADAMEAKGLLAAGYNRLNLDDGWMQRSRAPNGSLRWNETLFPHGIPWLARYVKSKGFSLGIYSDSGNLTCEKYPGGLGYEELDAKTYADWGIDYLKLDGCNMFPKSGQTKQEYYKEVYENWHRVISNMTKPLIFSESAPAYFCGSAPFLGPDKPANNSDCYRAMEWVSRAGELARHSDDVAVYNISESRPGHFWNSIMTNYGFEVQLSRYQQPGFYNDPDFLIADFPQLTPNERKSQFALWASFSAPLIISADVPNLSDEVVAYLANKDIVAIDQDPLGMQATLVSQDGTWDVLTKSLENGDRLLTVLNRGNSSASTAVDLARLGVPANATYTFKDLWTGTFANISGSVNVTLASHATAIYRISGVSAIVPTGMVFNIASGKCLAASSKKDVNFENCAALDSQVWRFASSGTISPLSSPSACLVSSLNSTRLETCRSQTQSQQWSYHISGNIVSAETGRCLAGERGKAGTETCGDVLERQVFGLPAGVKAIRGVQSAHRSRPRA